MYNNVLSGKHGRCIYGDVLVSTGMWNEETNNNFALAA